MRSSALLSLVLLCCLYGCARQTVTVSPFVEVPEFAAPVDYVAKIEPILNNRCVVCHSCYNAPCQLKLSSYDGLDRGASKEAVYHATRLHTMNPTRLFTDAQTTGEWREMGFSSVTETSGIDGGNDSLLLRLLAHKKTFPASTVDTRSPLKDIRNSFAPDFEKLTCSASSIELTSYLEKHPNRGMPYGFPPLTETEFGLIRDWLVSGARGPSEAEDRKRKAIHSDDTDEVEAWETFLNGEVYPANPVRDVKKMMTARYIYEHLFLAHITFADTTENGGDEERFYELVRSSSPPGEPLVIIPSRRPFDRPEGTEQVYYRFRRIHSTIVHKTHMVFEMTGQKRKLYQELFLDTSWKQEPAQWIPYQTLDEVNPFAVFDQIPADSRYRFLLEDIHYMIMTFIRGPVCKGQVALNVVQDHFWLLFMDPEHDLTVTDPSFLTENLARLKLPVDQSWLFDLLGRWKFYTHKSYVGKYVKARRELYLSHYHDRGPGLDAIWYGEKPDHTPVLTVFRHFDSASVHRGAWGNLPKTLWVMDYPLIERIYYALVAGFDVFGNRGHQMATRIYMDGLRQEGETYFLDFLPKSMREKMISEWYGNKSPKGINYIPSTLETGVLLTADRHAKRAFVEQLVSAMNDRHRPAMPDGREFLVFDDNYMGRDETYPPLAGPFVSREDFIRAFRAVSAPGTSFFKQVDEKGANVAYIRIRMPDGGSEVVSMVINRWHDDVRTMLFEEFKLQAAKDEAVFLTEYVGSYPNYFFVVDVEDLPDFLVLLNDFDQNNNCHVARLMFDYGVNRTEDDFWEHYDWFQRDFMEKHPRTAGIFDLNRYYHLAVDEAEFRKTFAGHCEGAAQ